MATKTASPTLAEQVEEHKKRYPDHKISSNGNWSTCETPKCWWRATSHSIHEVGSVSRKVFLASHILSMARDAGMPKEYWLTDIRIQHASQALGYSAKDLWMG